MRKEIDMENYFRMDKSIVQTFSSFEEAEQNEFNWIDRSAEERLLAAEFLRRQWIEWNKLPREIEKVVSFKALHENV